MKPVSCVWFLGFAVQRGADALSECCFLPFFFERKKRRVLQRISVSLCVCIVCGVGGVCRQSSYSVRSSIPASASASFRSTQVPHLPQCFVPPL